MLSVCITLSDWLWLIICHSTVCVVHIQLLKNPPFLHIRVDLLHVVCLKGYIPDTSLFGKTFFYSPPLIKNEKVDAHYPGKQQCLLLEHGAFYTMYECLEKCGSNNAVMQLVGVHFLWHSQLLFLCLLPEGVLLGEYVWYTLWTSPSGSQ